MNLAVAISLYGGGVGSGCHGPICGRPVSFVRNTNVFRAPPSVSAREQAAMHHYVIESDGASKEVVNHASYFSGWGKSFEKFMKQGGILVTVSAGGPGITFGKKDEETIDKVLQVAGHPEFREFGATVEYYNPATKEQFSFHGSRVGELGREMRAWMAQKKAA